MPQGRAGAGGRLRGLVVSGAIIRAERGEEEGGEEAVMPKQRKKKIRKLRGEIEELDRAMIYADTLEEWEEINAVEIKERSYLQDKVRVLETLELEEKAQPFGINLYPVRQIGEPLWFDKTIDGRTFLTDEGVARAKNLIIDARMSYWKRWIDIVTPVASTVISILALLIAVLALYLQISSDPIIVVPPPR